MNRLGRVQFEAVVRATDPLAILTTIQKISEIRDGGVDVTISIVGTRAEKRRFLHLAVAVLGVWSDREIARLCGVSPRTVATIRADLIDEAMLSDDEDDREGACVLLGHERRIVTRRTRRIVGPSIGGSPPLVTPVWKTYPMRLPKEGGA